MPATRPLLAGLLLLNAQLLFAQDIRGDLDELLAAASNDGASGVLRISLRGDVVYEAGYGSTNCDAGSPVQAQDVFMIGSITKEFTRLLGYVLEEQEFLSRTDVIGDLLTDLGGPIAEVTVQQLMDHTGGLPDLVDAAGRSVPYSVEYDYLPVTRKELIDRAGLAQLIADPGATTSYSNLGYQLLAAVYEAVTGATYPELLRQYVYVPAGMTDTDFWFSDDKQRRFVDGCLSGDERWGNPVDDRMWGEDGPSWNLLGAGGLLSTTSSLGRFFDGIGAGVYFETSGQLAAYKNDRMVMSKSRGQLVMGPAGSNGIFNAVAFWADRDELNIVLMTNRADHPGEGGLIRQVLAHFPPEHVGQ